MLGSLIPNAVWQALFVLLSLAGWLSAFYWWRRYQRLSGILLGGSSRPPVSTSTNLGTGRLLLTGEETTPLTMEVSRLMSVPGTHSVRTDILEILQTLPQPSKPSSRGGSGLRMVEGGAGTSGPTPPESAA